MYYSGHEIVQIALRVEENGHTFYTEGAKNITDNDNVKTLFLDLAKKEVKHIQVFKKLDAHFEDEGLTIDMTGADEYVHHVADTHIFQKKDIGSEMANSITSAKQALEIAYKFETDSVEFYKQMLTRAHAKSKPLIEMIIAEEQQHAADIKVFL